MEQIAIGKSGLTTSRIGLGTWAIGGWMWGGTEEAQSIATIQSAVERGVTLIDTAPVYGFGRSEEIVGKALAEGGLRERCRSPPRLAWPGRTASRIRDSRPAAHPSGDRGLVAAAADRRHRPLSGALAGSRDADRGNGADAGGSAPRGQDPGDRRQQLLARADGRLSCGGAKLDAVQPPYNLFEREIEADVLPYAIRRRPHRSELRCALPRPPQRKNDRGDDV